MRESMLGLKPKAFLVFGNRPPPHRAPGRRDLCFRRAPGRLDLCFRRARHQPTTAPDRMGPFT